MMFGLGKVDAAEITVAEHHAFSAQPTQILVTEIPTDKFPINPC